MAIPLPAALERTIKIKKGNDPLGTSDVCLTNIYSRQMFSIDFMTKNYCAGLTLELADRGINGMIVKNLSKSGAIFRDGRISVGDFLLSINSESLRNITNSKARAILRRAQLIGNDIVYDLVLTDIRF
jgi:C-terminal processing protease CtpA/Prc